MWLLSDQRRNADTISKRWLHFSCSSGYDSQSLSPGAPKTSAQQPKQVTIGEANSKSAESTHLIEPGGASYSDNKRAEEKMEQKRPPCVTKAEVCACIALFRGNLPVF